jgi:hypothetical protein
VLRVLRSMHPERARETHLVPPAENQQFAGSSKAITSDSSQTWSETPAPAVLSHPSRARNGRKNAGAT